MLLTCPADGSFHLIGCKCVTARKPEITGWICPKCDPGVAPLISYCDCNQTKVMVSGGIKISVDPALGPDRWVMQDSVTGKILGCSKDFTPNS